MIEKCLCCGKPLKEDEKNWHKRCIKKFFNRDIVPEIDLSILSNDLTNKAVALLDSRKNTTGVQAKLSIGLSSIDNKLTVLDCPLGYIIKPETNDFPDIARAEYLTMKMAKTCKINVVLNGLIKTNDGKFVYITKRIDRDGNRKIHMEDFCQLSSLMTERKYSGSYEKVGRLITKYSDHGKKDLSDYFYLILFNFISCNSDMHLKNFSLIEDDEIYLSPFYDLLPVNILYPNDSEETALTLNGKKKNLTKKDFYTFGINIGLNEKVVNNLIKEICKYKETFITMIKESLIEEKHKEDFLNELNRRIEILQK